MTDWIFAGGIVKLLPNLVQNQPIKLVITFNKRYIDKMKWYTHNNHFNNSLRKLKTSKINKFQIVYLLFSCSIVIVFSSKWSDLSVYRRFCQHTRKADRHWIVFSGFWKRLRPHYTVVCEVSSCVDLRLVFDRVDNLYNLKNWFEIFAT